MYCSVVNSTILLRSLDLRKNRLLRGPLKDLAAHHWNKAFE